MTVTDRRNPFKLADSGQKDKSDSVDSDYSDYSDESLRSEASAKYLTSSPLFKSHGRPASRASVTHHHLVISRVEETCELRPAAIN